MVGNSNNSNTNNTKAIIATITWCLVWVGVAIRYYNLKDSNTHITLSDIGGYISGVFAPIAWYWFYLSYRVQTEELKLQREELRNSVDAQQGSEIALHQQADTLRVQTETLAEQLRIAKEQWEIQLREKEKNKPKFVVKGYLLNYYLPADEQDVTTSIYDLIQNENNLTFKKSTDYNENSYIFGLVLTLDIKNVAGDCKIKDVRLLQDNQKKLTGNIKAWHANFEELKFEIVYFPQNNDIVREEQFKGSQFSNIFQNSYIEFSYSFGFTSDVDKYRIKYKPNTNQYEIEKVELADC